MLQVLGASSLLRRNKKVNMLLGAGGSGFALPAPVPCRSYPGAHGAMKHVRQLVDSIYLPIQPVQPINPLRRVDRELSAERSLARYTFSFPPP